MESTLKVLVAIASLCGLAHAQTLLPNGSFEDGTDACGWQAIVPPPWAAIAITPDLYTFDCSIAPGGLHPTDFGNFPFLPAAHDGLRFMAAWGDVTGPDVSEIVGVELIQPIVAGQAYVASGWFTESTPHPADGGYELVLSQQDGSPDVVAGVLGEISAKDIWTYDALEFVAEKDASWVLMDPLDADCYDGFDDLVLVEQPFTDLGFALPGTAGPPVLDALGTLVSGQPLALSLSSARPAAPATLVVGYAQLAAPFKGGVMVPTLDLLLVGFVTDAQGEVEIEATWPANIAAGVVFYMQWWIQDPSGLQGFAASNALQARTNGP